MLDRKKPPEMRKPSFPEAEKPLGKDFFKFHLRSDLLTGVDDDQWREISGRVPAVPLDVLMATSEPDIIDYHLAD